jgi:hypothetical protein
MTCYWVSWWSGNYADEGCTAPPFKFWTSGQRDRPNHGLNEEQQKIVAQMYDEDEYDEFLNEHARDDCSLCAVIDAESEDAVWQLVQKHFPDFSQRFCEKRAPDFTPGSRFQ